MTLRLALLAFTAPLLLLAGCGKGEDTSKSSGQPVAATPAPVGKAWSETVVKTPEGGIRMGNPDAPIKLVEYAAFSCPHCKDFTAEAYEPLRRDYVDTGKLSWEFRPFLLGALDVVPSLLARCQGPQPFFKLAEQTYAAQGEWIGRVLKLPQEQLQGLAGDFPGMARATGLDGFFRARGLTAAKLDVCLRDKAAIDELAAITEHATSQDGVTGTPTFLINGKLQENVASWEPLRERLADISGG